MPEQAVAGKRTTRPTMYVMVGLPASGKTTPESSRPNGRP
jgi:signal recognition particle GTPase